MSVDTNILRYQQKIIDSSNTTGSGDLVMNGRGTPNDPEYCLGKVAAQNDRLVLYIDADDGDWEIVQGVVWIDALTKVVTFHREQTLLSSNNNQPVNYQSSKKLVRSKPEWDWQLAIWQKLDAILAALAGGSSSAAAASSSSSGGISQFDQQMEMNAAMLRELRRIRKGSEWNGATATVPDDEAETEY